MGLLKELLVREGKEDIGAETYVDMFSIYFHVCLTSLELGVLQAGPHISNVTHSNPFNPSKDTTS
jgi:hypothetical protein